MTLLISALIAFTTTFATVLTPNVTMTTEVEKSSDKVKIVIESNDQMRFNLSEITVQQGQTVVC